MGKLTIYGEFLAKAQTLPANSSAQGNGGSRRAGSMLGAAEVVMVAHTQVSIAEAATLILSMQQSEDDASFTDMPVSFRKAAEGGAMIFAAGDVMARLPLASDTGKYVRAVIATDDETATGTVDIAFEYLPR